MQSPFIPPSTPRLKYAAWGNSVSVFSRCCLLLITLLALAGCPGPAQTDLDHDLGQGSWVNLENISNKARQASGPYNSSISFRLTMPEESYMLGAYIWSNNTLTAQHPLRLDLQSTVGSTVAKMKEEPDYFLLFDVKSNSAIVSRSAEEALASIRMPMPFMLGDLSLLLNGRYLEFFTEGEAQKPQLYATTPEKQSIFKIESGKKAGYLTINAKGYPVLWESASSGWSMELNYQDVTTLVANVTPLPGPNRITIKNAQGYSVAMQVKSLKKLPRAFTEKQLELLIPTGANVRELKTAQPQN